MSAAPLRDFGTAPKDGSQFLAYREDCGIMVVSWSSPCEFLSEDECLKMDEDGNEFSLMDNWWAEGLAGAYMVENDGLPTHWMPLPGVPSQSNDRASRD